MTTTLRCLMGLLSILLGCVACVVAIVVTGGPDVRGAAIALGCLALGFLGLAVTRTPDAPWRPVRASLAWASLVGAYMLYSLAYPLQGSAEWGGVLILATLLGAALTVSLFLHRRPQVAAGLLVVGAAYGVLMTIRYAGAIGSTPGVVQSPGLILSFVLASTCPIGWVAALWHARSLLRRRGDSSAVSDA